MSDKEIFDQDSAFDHLMNVKKRRDTRISLEEKIAKRKRGRRYIRMGIAATILCILGVTGIINLQSGLPATWADEEIGKLPFVISSDINQRGKIEEMTDREKIDKMLSSSSPDQAYDLLKALRDKDAATEFDLYNLSLLHVKRDEKQEAIQLLNKILERKENMMEARWLLGLIYYQEGNHEAALSHISKVNHYKTKEKKKLLKDIR